MEVLTELFNEFLAVIIAIVAVVIAFFRRVTGDDSAFGQVLEVAAEAAEDVQDIVGEIERAIVEVQNSIEDGTIGENDRVNSVFGKVQEFFPNINPAKLRNVIESMIRLFLSNRANA